LAEKIDSPKWSNPLVIGLFAAAIGLAGNVWVTRSNNINTQNVERSRTQSTIILEAIRTNGDTNAACKNLVFFASLDLIDDTNHRITRACPGNPQGVPSVSSGGPDKLGATSFYPLRVQTVDNNGAPLPGVSVEANLVTPIRIEPDWEHWVASDKSYEWIVGQGSAHCVSDKKGSCFLGMAPSDKFIVILAKKSGYAGNRTNILFTGTSVAVALQKNPKDH